MNKPARHQLKVDIRRCDAYGYCAEMLPEIIERDEWGYPIVTGPIGPDRKDQAVRVVAACPKLALALEAASEPAKSERARETSPLPGAAHSRSLRRLASS